MKTFAIAVFFLVFIWVGVQSASAKENSSEKPIIGINTDVHGERPEQCRVQSQYIQAILKSGGIPVLLPPMGAEEIGKLMPHLDGILMIGGEDYPPSLYKQEQHSSVSLMKENRTEFDMKLINAALAEKSIPVLGICAGCQALNIASGGSLTQDIPSVKPESKISHSSPDGWKKGFNKHSVQIDKGSKLSNLIGNDNLTVVSSHHQCVDKPGDNLKVVAKSEDGVIEAIEREGTRFIVGVQWHPERDFETNRKLFEEFVKQATQYHQSKFQKANL